jgi:hypothetical protein
LGITIVDDDDVDKTCDYVWYLFFFGVEVTFVSKELRSTIIACGTDFS